MRPFQIRLSLIGISAGLFFATCGLAHADSNAAPALPGPQQPLPIRSNDQIRHSQAVQPPSAQQSQDHRHDQHDGNDHHDGNDNVWHQHEHRPDVVVIRGPRDQAWPIYRERRPLIIYQQPAPVIYSAPQPYVVETPIAPTIVCSPQRHGLALDLTAGAVMTDDRGWAMHSGGAILSLALGNAFGGYADSTDQACVAEAAAYAPIGQTITWSSNSYGTEIEVLPLRDRWMNGMQCRDYETHVLIGNAWRRVAGTSCRQIDGSWLVMQ